MRKGSSDHLVVNIGSESERLIAAQDSDDKGIAAFFFCAFVFARNKEEDEERGGCSSANFLVSNSTVFLIFEGRIKSLHTSGFIPAQGKHIADRVDAFW
jgi:hypothetical protein